MALNMLGHPAFHDIDSALAEANKMPPENSRGLPKAFHAQHGTGDVGRHGTRPLHAPSSPARKFAAELTRDLARCAAPERESMAIDYPERTAKMFRAKQKSNGN